jgi:hypothetical protein
VNTEELESGINNELDDSYDYDYDAMIDEIQNKSKNFDDVVMS